MIAATPPCLRLARSDGAGAAETKAPKLVDGSISRMLTPAANILCEQVTALSVKVRPTAWPDRWQHTCVASARSIVISVNAARTTAQAP